MTPALQADSLPSEPSGKPMYICASVSVYICVLFSPQNLEKEAVITRNWYGLTKDMSGDDILPSFPFWQDC